MLSKSLNKIENVLICKLLNVEALDHTHYIFKTLLVELQSANYASNGEESAYKETVVWIGG